PILGVIAEVQLLYADQQATEFVEAEAVTFAQYPVVAQDLAHQFGALGNSILLVTALGVEAGNAAIGAGEHAAPGPKLLVGLMVRHAARLVAQHAIDHLGQRFTAQYLPGLSDQLIVQWMRTETLCQQPLEMAVQALLRLCITGVAQRPVAGQPVLQEGWVAACVHVQHQIGAQTAQQTAALVQVGAYLGFQLVGHARQQQGMQVVAVGTAQHRIDSVFLIQTAALQPGYIRTGRKHLAGGIAAVQRLESLQRIVSRSDLLALTAETLGNLAQLFQASMVG